MTQHSEQYREFGEVQADAYFNAFFERFELLADQPLAYPAIEHSLPLTGDGQVLTKPEFSLINAGFVR